MTDFALSRRGAEGQGVLRGRLDLQAITAVYLGMDHAALVGNGRGIVFIHDWHDACTIGMISAKQVLPAGARTSSPRSTVTRRCPSRIGREPDEENRSDHKAVQA
jgi:hypothetical protein